MAISWLAPWITAGLWGVGSVVWAEWVRDSYHALAHVWPTLYRLHVWHHRAFRPDLSIVDAAVYQRSQWVNDVPECLVMLTLSGALWGSLQFSGLVHSWGVWAGSVYTLFFLAGAIARGTGWGWAHDVTDLTHLPGRFLAPPSEWRVNRTYHWRHHFDNQKAYYSGSFSFFDKLWGTALSLKGKTVAITGASGTLGRSLLKELIRQGAKPIALTSSGSELRIDGTESDTFKTVTWQIGHEESLDSLWKSVDILILNHGINVGSDRSVEALDQSYEVNTFSQWKLLNSFLKTVETNAEIAQKEVWVNTSEAEVNPAFSPLYELSKRTLGDWVSLRRLDSPCIIRKLILGPFRSALNPVGIMAADGVSRQIIALAKRDFRNIIVTINPVTYVLFPLREFFVSLYFKLFTRSSPPSPQ